MARATSVIVRPAAWPQDEATARALLQRYADWLRHGPAHVVVSGIEQEVASVSHTFREPNAVLLLAFLHGVPAGCVVVHVRAELGAACEMKRMWVEPTARGAGVARALSLAAIAWSRAQHAERLLLDTLPEAMPEAGKLYRSLGFTDAERYNTNAIRGIRFMQLHL